MELTNILVNATLATVAMGLVVKTLMNVLISLINATPWLTVLTRWEATHVTVLKGTLVMGEFVMISTNAAIPQ